MTKLPLENRLLAFQLLFPLFLIACGSEVGPENQWRIFDSEDLTSDFLDSFEGSYKYLDENEAPIELTRSQADIYYLDLSGDDITISRIARSAPPVKHCIFKYNGKLLDVEAIPYEQQQEVEVNSRTGSYSHTLRYQVESVELAEISEILEVKEYCEELAAIKTEAISNMKVNELERAHHFLILDDSTLCFTGLNEVELSSCLRRESK